MRSTVIIDDDLFKKVRRRAAELDMTISDIVNDALRQALARKPVEPPPFKLPAFGNPRRRVHHEPAQLGTEDDDDISRLRG